MPEDGAASSMSPEEIDAYLTEMEPDLRAADRDLQEIEALLKKGVTGSGKLPGRFLPLWHEDSQRSLFG
jgi:P-type Cu+ transporter